MILTMCIVVSARHMPWFEYFKNCWSSGIFTEIEMSIYIALENVVRNKTTINPGSSSSVSGHTLLSRTDLLELTERVLQLK